MIEKLNTFFKALNNSLRLFATLLFLHILELSFAQAQKITPYFSTISEIPLYRGNKNLLVGDFNGDGFQDICSYNNGIISIIYNSGDFNNWNIKYYETDNKKFIASVDDINSDGMSDIIYLDPGTKQLRVYLGAKQDTLINRWKFKLEDSFSNFIIADINGDNKKDIILFGKKNLGLTVFQGKGDGTFRYPQNILQDYFFSYITICNCSEDDIPDIFAINWIDNKILFFISYSPMKYLSPSVISFNIEPISLQTLYINDDDFVDLAVLLEDKQTIVTFLGDNLGNYFFKDKIYSNNTIDKFFINGKNNLSYNTLILFNKPYNLFSIMVKNNFFKYNEDVVYSIGTDASDFELIFRTINSDIFDIVVSSEKNKKLYLLQNNQYSNNPKLIETKYLTMPFPENIFLVDLNNDKNPDILLSSSSNYSCGLYINNNGQFSGMVNLKEFPKNIENIYLGQIDNGRYYSITTHTGIPSVNLGYIDSTYFQSNFYPVAGIPNPEILYVKDKSNGEIEFFLLSSENDSKYVNLYYYQQLGKYKFIEKLITSLGENLLGVTMLDLNYDEHPDYLYLKKNYRNNIILMSSTLDSNYNILNNKKHFEIQDTSITKYFIIKEDINNDDYIDLLFYSPGQMKLILSLYNTADSLFNKPHQIIENVKLNSLNNLQFCDFDRNNMIDLIIGNSYTQTLQVFFNKGNGHFSNPETIMGIYEISSFLAKDLNNDSHIDLALVYKDGFLKIVYGQ